MDILLKLKYAKKHDVPRKYLYYEDGELQSPYFTYLAVDKFNEVKEDKEEQSKEVVGVWKALRTKLNIEKNEFINMFLTPLVPEDMTKSDEKKLIKARYKIMTNFVETRLQWKDYAHIRSRTDFTGDFNYYDTWYNKLVDEDEDQYNLIVEELNITKIEESNINLESDNIVTQVSFMDQLVTPEMGKQIFLSSTEKNILASYTNENDESLYIINRNGEGVPTEDESIVYLLNGNIKVVLDLRQSVILFKKTEDKYKVYKLIREAVPGLNIENEKEDVSRGSFVINIDIFNESHFYYLIVLDTFMNMIYLRESGKPRSLMKNKVYNIMIQDQEIKFQLTKAYSGVEVTFKGDNLNRKIIDEFFGSLYIAFKYYSNKAIDTDVISGEIVELEEKVERNTSRANELIAKTGDPDMFQKGKYVKVCASRHQPIIIDPEDLEDWINFRTHAGEQRTHMVFKDKYYVCPFDAKPNPKLTKTKTYKYKCVPCCGDNPNYPTEPDDEECDTKKGGTVKAKKYGILGHKQPGKVVPHLAKRLESLGLEDVERMGNIEGNNALIHGVLRAYFLDGLVPGDDKLKELLARYSAVDVDEKEEIVMEVREYISKTNLCKQELYDLQRDEIKEMMTSDKLPYQSDLFFRALEYFFRCHIFVFCGDRQEKSKPVLETPRHLDVSLRNMTYPRTLLFYRQKGRYNYYDNISSEGDFILGKEVASQLLSESQIYTVKLGLDMYGWKGQDKVVNKAVKQMINESGRTFALKIKNKKEYLTLYIPETPPYHFKEIAYHSYDLVSNATARDFAEKMNLGEEVIGNGGLWFGRCFIPTNEHLKGKKHQLFEMAQAYKKEIDDNQDYIFSELLLKIIIYRWASVDMEVEEFITEYIKLSKVRIEPPIRDIIMIPDKDIEFIESSWPSVFKGGKIYLHSELKDNVEEYLRHYSKSNIVKKRPYIDTKNLNYLDERQYLGWKSDRGCDRVVKTEIEENQEPYILYFRGSFWIAQQIRGNLSKALRRCQVWKYKNVNRSTSGELYYKDAKYELLSVNLGTITKTGDDYLVVKIDDETHQCLLKLE